MIRALLLFLGLTTGAAAQDNAVVIQVDGAEIAANGATIKGLDRINGVVREIQIAPGETVRYERLDIMLRECRYPVGDEKGDAFAYLTIRDIRGDEMSFEGWMFASSPALSALDHPRYDVWVTNCNI